jgi:hypothetical protein
MATKPALDKFVKNVREFVNFSIVFRVSRVLQFSSYRGCCHRISIRKPLLDILANIAVRGRRVRLFYLIEIRKQTTETLIVPPFFTPTGLLATREMRRSEES